MASGSAGSSLPIGDRKAPEDILGRLLPLPYRVAVIIVLGLHTVSLFTTASN